MTRRSIAKKKNQFSRAATTSATVAAIQDSLAARYRQTGIDQTVNQLREIMVGFGSGLRMGRRTGWESAYLDYETLKLLLSQIEAVYEERDLGTGMSADGFFMSMPGGLSGGVADSERNVTTSSERNNENSRPKTTNYRDELFLESDSDLAFASEVDVNDNSSESDEYRNRDYDIDRAMMDESLCGCQKTWRDATNSRPVSVWSWASEKVIFALGARCTLKICITYSGAASATGR